MCNEPQAGATEGCPAATDPCQPEARRYAGAVSSGRDRRRPWCSRPACRDIDFISHATLSDGVLTGGHLSDTVTSTRSALGLKAGGTRQWRSKGWRVNRPAGWRRCGSHQPTSAKLHLCSPKPAYLRRRRWRLRSLRQFMFSRGSGDVRRRPVQWIRRSPVRSSRSGTAGVAQPTAVKNAKRRGSYPVFCRMVVCSWKMCRGEDDSESITGGKGWRPRRTGKSLPPFRSGANGKRRRWRRSSCRRRWRRI